MSPIGRTLYELGTDITNPWYYTTPGTNLIQKGIQYGSKKIAQQQLGKVMNKSMLEVQTEIPQNHTINLTTNKEYIPNKLNGAIVYKGKNRPMKDNDYNFFTSDPSYAAQYGSVTPYYISFNNPGFTYHPLQYRDMDGIHMTFEGNPIDVIIGKDQITKELLPNGKLLQPSRGEEYAVWNKGQIHSMAPIKYNSRPISEAERLGIPRGDRGNLNRFQREAIEDLHQYRISGQNRQTPFLNADGKLDWEGPENEHILRTFTNKGGQIRGDRAQFSGKDLLGAFSYRVDKPSGAYVSYRGFQSTPFGRLGGASVSTTPTSSRFILTSPKADALNIIAETPENEILREQLIEQSSPTISKEIMKDFWINVTPATKPGVYLSGDEGNLPLGSELIKRYKAGITPIKDNSGKTIGVQTPDLANTVLNKQNWTGRKEGLSTDSYMSLLKQGQREPWSLRFSPDGMTVFNDQSFENKFMFDLLKKANAGEIPKEQFLKEFSKWVKPYNGMDAKIVNNKIIIPQPFIFKKKQGGEIKKRDTN